jgi:hypothetical protein
MVGGSLRLPLPLKLVAMNDIAEILLKVALKHQKIKSNRRGALATANRAHAFRRHCLRISVRGPIALYFH